MKLNYTGPVVLAILDGVGLRREVAGNAVKQAHTEFLNYAVGNYKTTSLEASGEAVGILPGNMGNSEVGHNVLGSGQIIKQGIAQINDAISSGAIWQSAAWQDISERLKNNPESTLHFSGIFSDGNVHSSIYHLEKMIEKAHEQGVKHIRIHLVLDGRDTPPQSALQYVAELEAFIKSFADNPDYRIASGGGRMVFVADRYENDWDVVKAGWDAIVNGVAPHQFPSATAAINTFREKDPSIQDQYIPPFVIFENGQPVGTVKEGDSFIYYDFRADRAIEIAQAKEFVDKLEDGLDAHVAQGGTNFSGGQKQRLSIARAVCRKPDIYIFDDSFSALDYKTDRILRGELKKITKEAITLIVAQRIGTIADADCIVVLDEGRVAGMGKHKDLLANCEVYRQIAYSQLSKEELENE